MFAAYVGFYPRTTYLKTWKRLDSFRTLREAWVELYKGRDDFLAAQNGDPALGVELVVKRGGKPIYLPLPEWQELEATYPLVVKRTA